MATIAYSTSSLPWRRCNFRKFSVIGVRFLVLIALAMPGVSAACNKREPTRETSEGPHDYTTVSTSAKLWREEDTGEPLNLRMRVLDTCGNPVAGAKVQILHADENGAHDPERWRTTLDTDERGRFKLITVFPGYAGFIARHIHFIISHPKHPTLVTRLFFANDPEMDHGIKDLAMILEEIPRGESRGWVSGYEFVLADR